MDTSRVPLARQSRLRTIVASLTAAVVATLIAFVPLAPSHADGSWVRGIPIDGLSGWLGTWVPYQGQPVPGLCIQADAVNPAEHIAITPSQLTDQPSLVRPDDLSVDIPQMAYIMKKWTPTSLEFSDNDLDAAATAFLAHVNFENSARAQANVDTLVSSVPAYIQDRARQMVAEAKNVGVVGWEAGETTGQGTRFGTFNNIGVKNGSHQYVAGHPFTMTLRGPAVFEATGTNTYTGTTEAAPINGIKWRSTGNGTIYPQVRYENLGDSALGHGSPGGNRQDVIWYDNFGSRVETVDMPSFDVIFDFQPKATSNVAEGKRLLTDTTTLSDTLSAFADPNYGDGSWLVIDGDPVDVVFEGTAYHTGDKPAAESGSVPADAKIIGTTSLTFDGPSTQTATITTSEPVGAGFVTWVWKVIKNNQTGTVKSGSSDVKISDLVHADWADAYGLVDETSTVPHAAEINTAISSRITKAGTYLVDDVWVSGMPADHPSWAGSHGFTADVATLTQTLLFFPDGLEVVEANKAQAEVIASVELPAKNGYYPTVGANEFKVKDGVPGTYVFVTSFAGDDRVAAMTTSVEDVTEQFTINGEVPEIGTTATDKTDGDKILDPTGPVTVVDKVCASKGLVPGKEYTVNGVLMDKDTGKPVEENGQPVTSSKTFTAQTPTDCVDVEFTLDGATLVGKTTVVFEDLLVDGKRVATHADINDEGQTVTTPPVSIGTTATDKADGDKHLDPDTTVTVADKVCYENLTPGKEYVLDGVLMNKATNKPLQEGGKNITASKTFTPDNPAGCETVEFTFNTTSLAGSSIVVFENLMRDGIQVATHADINDEGQTVTVKQPAKKKNLAKTGSGADLMLITAALTGAAGAGATYAMRRRKTHASR